MRLLALIIILFNTFNCFSQVAIIDSSETMNSGKEEFKLQEKSDTSDYSKAFQILTKQVNKNPTNAEFRYFLGCTIDRLNAVDGRGMYQLKKELTIQSSEQFEEVNRLEPVYKGELYLLDPYAKLSSIWGSLAQAYLTRKQIDSARWAFTEGKRRGGFMEPFLEFNRQLLNSCDNNAILVTSGDNITIPIWYLQAIENYRTDITVVDANLLNTKWYPKYLKAERNLSMSFSDAVIDTIEYCQWHTQKVNAINLQDSTQIFSWELAPTYMDSYILKGNRILLDIFQQNLFSRPIYFTSYSDSTYNLSLFPYLANEGLVDRVIPEEIDWESNSIVIHTNIKNYNIEKLHKKDISRSRDAIILLNNYRWCYYTNISNLITQSKYDLAKELIKEMNNKFNKVKLPYTSVNAEQYFNELFIRVKEGSGYKAK